MFNFFKPGKEKNLETIGKQILIWHEACMICMTGEDKNSSKELGAHTTVGLTSLGSAKVENGSLQGKYYDVGAALKDEGASSLSELSRTAHIEITKLKHMIKSMMARGYVRRVGADET